MDFDLTAILQDFQEEASEHLEALQAQLLQLERDPAAPEPIRAMFLSAHTIKGSAAMLDLGHISVLAHAMEDVLAYLRDVRQPLDTSTADLLFRAVDALRDRIGRSAPCSNEDAALDSLVAALRDRAKRQVELSVLPVPEPHTAAYAPRALLLDDSATVRMLEAIQLADAGFQVDVVIDGKQALALALTHTYDVIVTGIECQALGGWELAAALREVASRRAVPIIMMSSDDTPENRQRAEEVGVHAYLRKGSLNRQQLEETARKLLAGSRRAASSGGIQ